MRIPAAVFAISLFLPGCPSPDGPNPDRVPRVVTSPDGDIGVVVGGASDFTWALYGAFAEEAGEDNVFFSPFSITAALSMTLAGAEGVTETEMQAVLGVEGEEAAWHAALGSLIGDLSGDLDRGYTLHIANRLFGQEGYPFEEPFLAVCADDYGAPLQSANFTGDPEGERQAINDWVAEQTQDRIQDLLPAGSIDGYTRLVLANAIYFLADWKTAFDPEDTQNQPFYLLNGSQVQVPMMWLDLEGVEDHGIEAAWVDGASVLRLPYTDDEVSMIVVIPDDLDGLPDLEQGLDSARFDGWVAALAPAHEAQIGLPKFEMTWEDNLIPTLAALGMPSAFSSSTADFTGIADVPDEPLFITGVFHKAFVKVDEAGTEAAAATGVVVGTDSATMPTVADRPFLFAIRDDLTGALLFVGRVTDPS